MQKRRDALRRLLGAARGHVGAHTRSLRPASRCGKQRGARQHELKGALGSRELGGQGAGRVRGRQNGSRLREERARLAQRLLEGGGAGASGTVGGTGARFRYSSIASTVMSGNEAGGPYALIFD